MGFNDKLLRNGYMYRCLSVKWDVIGQRYKMGVRRFAVMFYSRKQSEQYEVRCVDYDIFISTFTPIIAINTEMSRDEIIEMLKENWAEVYEYAAGNVEPRWIGYIVREENSHAQTDEESIIKLLKLDPDEYVRMVKRSPYAPVQSNINTGIRHD